MGFNIHSMKIEALKFNGDDPTDWAFRVEDFFDFHNTPNHLRLKIISFHMEGRASAWYQWMKENNMLTTWPNFLVSLKTRFGTSIYEDHQGNLSKLA